MTPPQDQTEQRTPKRGARRILKWLFILVAIFVAFVAAIPVAGYFYQRQASAADAKRFPAPGELVDLGGYRLHVLARGAGSPTVILDSASLDTVSGWYWVIEELSAITQVVAYDRPGLGWSDLGPEPRDVDLNARQLHQALELSGIHGPYVLVGHSLGGLYTRAFAGHYPDEVAGMVLIEATHPDFPARLGLPNVMPNADEGMLNAGPYAARLGLLRLMHMFPPDADLPAQQQAELGAYYASNNFADRTLSAYREWPNLLAEAASVPSLGDTPLRVIVGGASENAEGVSRELQEELLGLSTDSHLTVVEGATHITLVHNREHAHAVTAEIIGLITQIRERGDQATPQPAIQ